MSNQFGNKIKGLRKANNLFQRQVASRLGIDTPMLSKIERGERKAKKKQVLILSTIFKVDSKELLTIWLSDQVVDMVKDEENALQAMIMAEEQIKYSKINK